MRAGGERWRRAAVVTIALAVSTACSAPEIGPPVPTFAPPVPAVAAAPDGPDPDGVLPGDCEQILPVADLGAVLGLPLDTVAVRTTRGVPAPSVGRTERVACEYTTTAGGSDRGGPLLATNAGLFVDDAAAEKQWRVNADAEDGPRRELGIGSASAVLIEDGGESVLMVVRGSATLTMVLPRQPLPADRPAPEVVEDLALRVLAVLPAPMPVAAGPVQAAGASS